VKYIDSSKKDKNRVYLLHCVVVVECAT